jgi:hypothetical protein
MVPRGASVLTIGRVSPRGRAGSARDQRRATRYAQASATQNSIANGRSGGRRRDPARRLPRTAHSLTVWLRLCRAVFIRVHTWPPKLYVLNARNIREKTSPPVSRAIVLDIRGLRGNAPACGTSRQFGVCCNCPRLPTRPYSYRDAPPTWTSCLRFCSNTRPASSTKASLSS